MKKKNKRKKKQKFHWLYIVIVALLFCVLVFQARNEREAARFFKYGNQSYKNGDYTAASDYYNVALNDAKKLFLHRECAVRCNMALAIVAQLSREPVTEDNLDETITELENAIYLLTANDCAHQFDNGGHSTECQTLKNEIEDYLEKLRPPEPEPEPEPEKKDEPEKKEETDPDESLREALEDIQKEGMMQRKDEMDTAERLTTDFEYYSGACW